MSKSGGADGAMLMRNNCSAPAFGVGTIGEELMKTLIITVAAASLLMGMANVAVAQDTVIHKESADGDASKTVVKSDDGAKTVVKRHGDRMKKVHIDPNGDKTVVKKDVD
jgi:hypothetical protein